jgi:lipoprotein-anchoring transpeptidase ErfK/SrfK
MQSPQREIHIHVGEQRLFLKEGQQVLESFPVSTSAWGLGVEPGSQKTPTGRFCICEKIGNDAPPWAVFKSRLPTGEIGSEESPDDLVQSRILWLHGLEDQNANTRDRYIYIHGTNKEAEIGTPASHGCVRMRNADVIALYDKVVQGTPVFIHA